jgi:NUMOD4 motif
MPQALLKFMKHWQNLSLENIQEFVDGELRTEEWRVVPGFEKYYHASSFGRIKSLSRSWLSGENRNTPRIKEDTILKQWYKDKKEKYLRTEFSVNGDKIIISVHRLIASVFHENPLNLPEPNHLNSDPEDNRYWNLKWNTRKQNIEYSFEHGLRYSMDGVNNLNAVVDDDLVRIIRKEYAAGGETHRGLATKYNVGHTTIRQIVTFKTWKHVTN